MADLLNSNEIFFTQFEPKVKNRFLLYCDGIPSFLIRKVKRPTVTSEKKTLDHINIQRYYKGKTTWDNITMELYDPIVPSGAQAVMEWVRLSHESVTGRDGYSDFYKKDLTINVLGPVVDKVEFHPPHRGHLNAYNFLKLITGNDTYVSTSGKVELPDSPLTFGEKQQIWVRHGIAPDHIVQTKSPYKSLEITQKYDPDKTSVIFALGQKDAERLRVDQGGYFKSYTGNTSQLDPLSKSGYVLIIPEIETMVDGKTLSGTAVRQMLGSDKYTDDQKEKFFRYIFGWYDIALFKDLTQKFKYNKMNESIVSKLKKIVALLKEDAIKDATKKSKDAVVKQRRVELEEKVEKLKTAKLRLSNLSKTQVTTTNKETVPTDVTEQTDSVDLAKQRKDAQDSIKSAEEEVNQAKAFLAAAQKELSAVSI